MAIQAIETEYNGCRFRSRIEARWAVFYDALGIKWEYEKQGVELGDGVRYLPDFWLPQQKCWIEIKGAEPTDEEEHKAQLLAIFSGHPVYIFYGDIPYPYPDFGDNESAIAILPARIDFWNRIPYGDPNWKLVTLNVGVLTHDSIVELMRLDAQSSQLAEQIMGNNYTDGQYINRAKPLVLVKHLKSSATSQLWSELTDRIDLSDKLDWHVSFLGAGWDNQFYWCECPTCGLVGIEFNGRSDRLECKECYYCSRIKQDGKWSLDAGNTRSTECPVHGSELVSGCPRISPNRDKGYTHDATRLRSAYELARSARFEHGETPKVPRGKPRK